MMRATPSTDPPGGNGTMTVTVRVGKSCADARPGANERTSARAKSLMRLIETPIHRSGMTSLKRARIAAAVDQQALAGNVTRMHRAKKRAKGTELGEFAVALGRAGLGAFAEQLNEGLAGAFEHAANVSVLGVAVEEARQQIVDGHVVCGGLSRETGGEADQAGACAVREAELALRDFHAARYDVDDAAETARHHAVHGEPHHLDRAEHHVVERGDPIVTGPVAKVAGQWTLRIVDQDIGPGAGGECRGAACRRGQVAGNRCDLDTGRLRDFGAAAFEYVAGPRHDDEIDAGLSQRQRAGFAEAAARAAHQRGLAGDAEVQVTPLRSFPRRRIPATARLTWVPASAGTSGRKIRPRRPTGA